MHRRKGIYEMKKYPVTERYLEQLNHVLSGKADKYEIQSVKENTKRYLKKCKEDTRNRVVYYNS